MRVWIFLLTLGTCPVISTVTRAPIVLQATKKKISSINHNFLKRSQDAINVIKTWLHSSNKQIK